MVLDSHPHPTVQREMHKLRRNSEKLQFNQHGKGPGTTTNQCISVYLQCSKHGVSPIVAHRWRLPAIFMELIPSRGWPSNFKPNRVFARHASGGKVHEQPLMGSAAAVVRRVEFGFNVVQRETALLECTGATRHSRATSATVSTGQMRILSSWIEAGASEDIERFDAGLGRHGLAPIRMETSFSKLEGSIGRLDSKIRTITDVTCGSSARPRAPFRPGPGCSRSRARTTWSEAGAANK